MPREPAALARAAAATFRSRARVRERAAVARVETVIREAWEKLLALLHSAAPGDARKRAAAILRRLPDDVRDSLREDLLRTYREAYREQWGTVARHLPAVAWRVLAPKQATEAAGGGETAGLTADVDDLEDPPENPQQRKAWYRKWEEKFYRPPDEREARKAIDKPARFDGKRWFDRLSPRYARLDVETVANVMAAGMAEGRNPRSVARDLRGHVEGYRGRALCVARTEMLRAAQVAQRDAYDAFERVIGGWQVISAGDDRVRPDHVERHGWIYSDDDALHPDAAADKRPETPDEPNCRCVVVPVVKPELDLRRMADAIRKQQKGD